MTATEPEPATEQLVPPTATETATAAVLRAITKMEADHENLSALVAAVPDDALFWHAYDTITARLGVFDGTLDPASYLEDRLRERVRERIEREAATLVFALRALRDRAKELVKKGILSERDPLILKEQLPVLRAEELGGQLVTPAPRDPAHPLAGIEPVWLYAGPVLVLTESPGDGAGGFGFRRSLIERYTSVARVRHREQQERGEVKDPRYAT